MYNNNPYSTPGYGQPQQWQQQQPPPPPPPGGMAPPPPPAAGMNAEEAAQFRNYGYGSLPQRGAAGRGQGQPPVQGQQGVAPRPGQHAHQQPFSPAVPPQQHHLPPHPAPGQGGGPPNKRPRFDSGSHNAAGLPQNPQYHQPPPHTQQQAMPMQMQGQQPMQYAYPQQYQPPLPPGPAPPMQQQAQAYYPQPQQVAYPMQQQQQPYSPAHAPPHAQPPQQGYYPPQHPQHMPLQQQSMQAQPYPAQHGYQQPNHTMPPQHLPPQPPPLAVAPMKSGPMGASNFRKANNNNNRPHGLPPTPGLPPPPPPPANEPPPPPPPMHGGPPGVVRPQGGTIRLDQKGAATLPPTPTGAAAFPAVPGIAALPNGPSSSGPSIRRDTRPLPSQSTTAAAARHPLPPHQNSQSHHQDNHRTSGLGGGRGGRGGSSFPARGGRGGAPSGRGGHNNDRRALGRSGGVPFDARSNASSGSGNKRTFSQTSAGGANGPSNPKFARQRADSNATVTSQSMGRGGAYGNKRMNNGKFDRFANQRSAPGSGPPSSPASVAGNQYRASSVLSNDPRGAKGSAQKQTLTDFRIESLEIVELDWAWKATPLSEILERLDLKDRQEREKRERESTIGEEAEFAVKQEEQVQEIQDQVHEEQRTEDTDDPAAQANNNADPCNSSGGQEVQATLEQLAQVSADSSTMQRKDSRREKRKHSEDEDQDIQAAGNRAEAVTLSNDAPAGKKVKSDLDAEHAEQSLPDNDSAEGRAGGGEIEQATNADNVAVSQSNDPTDSLGEVGDNTMLVSTSEGDTTKGDDAESVTSEDTNADAEIAASVIARPGEGESRSVSKTPGPAPSEDGFADQKDHITLPPSTQASQSLYPPLNAAISKKYRENSRLRIYFSSPTDNQLATNSVVPVLSKSKKKREKQRGQKRKAKLDSDALRAQREMSIESRMTEGTSYTEVHGREQDPQPDDNEEDEDEDLDGEPLEPEAAGDELENGTEATQSEPTVAASEKTLDSDLQSNGADIESKAVDEDTNALADSAVKGKLTAPTEPPAALEAEPEEESKEAKAAGEQASMQPEEEDTAPEPSDDRISISYARNSRRFILDANVVEELSVYRAEGKIEMKVRLASVKSGGEEERLRYCQGVYVETIAQGNNDFMEVARQALRDAWPTTKDEDDPSPSVPADDTRHQADELLPPLHRLLAEDTISEQQSKSRASQDGSDSFKKAFKHEFITIIARVDRANPLTEAKWVRTGKTDDWIQSVSGFASANDTISNAAANGADKDPKGETSAQIASAWKGKIRVVDPDAPPPPPTFQHVLENWLATANTRNGFDEARYRFVSTYFKDINNVLEVLLRLIRGVPSGSSSQYSNHHQQTGMQSSPAFQTAVSASSPPFPEQQTPISLASFQLFKLGIEAAIEAGMAQDAIDKKIGEVVRSLPYFLVAKALDSLFLDYKKAVKAEARGEPAPPTGPAGLAASRQAPKRQRK